MLLVAHKARFTIREYAVAAQEGLKIRKDKTQWYLLDKPFTFGVAVGQGQSYSHVHRA